jgi:hypothetical protein
MRSSPLPSAIRTLRDSIDDKRAYRKRRFDVYLPPLTSFEEVSSTTPTTTPHHAEQQQKRQKQHAILFFPGANVPHIAYSEIAARLSDHGLLVVVLSMEPFRLASTHLGADQNSVKRIVQKLERSSFGSQVDLEWTLIGHSMGAFAVCQLFRDFWEQEQQFKTTSPHNNNFNQNTQSLSISRLVLLGVGAFVAVATDLSCIDSSSGDNDRRILIVQGSNNQVVAMLSANQNEFDALFPQSCTQRETIAGGTHGGFASYGDKTGMSGSKNNDALSREEQQEQACALTARFLLGKREEDDSDDPKRNNNM